MSTTGEKIARRMSEPSAAAKRAVNEVPLDALLDRQAHMRWLDKCMRPERKAAETRRRLVAAVLAVLGAPCIQFYRFGEALGALRKFEARQARKGGGA